MKLNVLLAKTDALASSFRACVNDYYNFFSNKQGEFRGERKTYEPASGMIDIPGNRGEKKVVTTVDEKLKWLEESNKEYIDALFAQEATNASGSAKAELKVDGKSWGIYSSLELLRLKSLIENGDMDRMYSTIPVRSDAEIWEANTQEMYTGRSIMQSALMQGEQKSSVKEQYILPDPNAKDAGGKYTPQVAVKDTIITLGSYTHQRFSGEWSHRQRAELLRRKQVLIVSIIEALKVANEVEAIKSELTSEKIFGYLHRG